MRKRRSKQWWESKYAESFALNPWSTRETKYALPLRQRWVDVHPTSFPLQDAQLAYCHKAILLSFCQWKVVMLMTLLILGCIIQTHAVSVLVPNPVKNSKDLRLVFLEVVKQSWTHWSVMKPIDF